MFTIEKKVLQIITYYLFLELVLLRHVSRPGIKYNSDTDDARGSAEYNKILSLLHMRRSVHALRMGFPKLHVRELVSIHSLTNAFFLLHHQKNAKCK